MRGFQADGAEGPRQLPVQNGLRRLKTHRRAEATLAVRTFSSNSHHCAAAFGLLASLLGRHDGGALRGLAAMSETGSTTTREL